jgi:hypothetical protein
MVFPRHNSGELGFAQTGKTAHQDSQKAPAQKSQGFVFIRVLP